MDEQTLRTTHALSRWVLVLVWAVVATSVCLAGSVWLMAGTTREPGYNWVSANAPVAAADRIGRVLTLLSLPLAAAAGVASLVWLWRVRRNAERMSATPHRRRELWVWLAWFVPVVQLWFPYQVVADVWRASEPTHPRELALPARPTPRWLPVWWVTFVASVGVERYIDHEWAADVITGADLTRLAQWETLDAVLVLVAARLWTQVVRSVRRDQTDRAHRLAMRP